MDVALIGLLGVIVGSVSSVGVQAIAARFDRRRRARTAARLLTVTLAEAEAAIEAARKGQEWTPPSLNWDQFGLSWMNNHDALATVLNTKDFMAVATAFSGIAALGLMRSEHLRDKPPPPATKWSFTGATDLIKKYQPMIATARGITWDAARTRRERRSDDG